MFENPDLPNLPTFVSALAIDAKLLGCDPERVHVVWSMSKDLAASGIRLVCMSVMYSCFANVDIQGCVATQNKELRDVIALVGSVHVSTISTVCSSSLLASPQLPHLLQLSRSRLVEAYMTLTKFFKASGVEYFPCNSTTFVMARLAPLAQTWEDEAAALGLYKLNGVLLSSGHAYHMSGTEKGWMRVSFAVGAEVLATAISRIEIVFHKLNERPSC